MKVLPRLKWLNAIVPTPVKEWLTATDKSYVPVMDVLQFSDTPKHPAESRMTRVIDNTPKP